MVTPTLERPVAASSLYTVTDPRRIRGQQSTDLQGHPLVQGSGAGGDLTLAVHPIPGVAPSPIGGLTSSGPMGL